MEDENMDEYGIFVVIERWYERTVIDDGYDCHLYFDDLKDAKKYVDSQLEEYLMSIKDYYEISEDDEEGIKEFNDELETINDDWRGVYGVYPYHGKNRWLEFKIKQVVYGG